MSSEEYVSWCAITAGYSMTEAFILQCLQGNGTSLALSLKMKDWIYEAVGECPIHAGDVVVVH